MSTSKHPVALVILGSLLAASLAPIPPAAADGSRPAGQNLTVDGDYTVSGDETWDIVIVKEGGTLVIPQGTRLNAKSIYLQGGSFVASGGSVAVTQTAPGGDAVISGNCVEFNISGGSKLTLTAPDGGTSMDVSQGGEAIVSVNASAFVKVTGGSEITCMGGNGRGTTTPWTTSALSGYVSAGGRGQITLGGPQTPLVELSGGARFITIGRNGGRAADGLSGSGGTGGRGGGYSNGGMVSGFVGSGGDGAVLVRGLTSIISGISVDCTGGKGGDAGNGGAGSTSGGSIYYYSGGGGGGGYGGGDGGSDYMNSGRSGSATDNVGTGGYARFQIESENVVINRVNVVLKGGNGGAPGSGGRGGAISSYYYYSPGGGGGGFGGGGGGSSYASGSNGGASGNVGAGGEANMSVTCKNLTMDELSLSCTGGDSSNGGAGGNGNYGGGGGGGYGGGGGGGGYNGGGAGTASGNVGSGGNGTLVILANNVSAVNSSIQLRGGTAGSGGTGGNGGSYGGGGGGGYGGGGGGGYYNYQGAAGSGSASANVGRGGMAMMRVTALYYLWLNSSYINATGGTGGNGGSGGSGGNAGGGGGGYTGSGGGGYSGTAGEGQATGNAGDGGDAEVSFYCYQGSIPADYVHINAVGGTKGDGKTSKGGGSAGGKGAGRATAIGGTPRNVPRLTPLPTAPADGTLFNNEMPRLTWMKMLDGWIYPSLPDPVINYEIQLDDNSSFSSLDEDAKTIDPELSYYYPTSLRGGRYHWRIRGIYEGSRTSGWSSARNFLLNGPPEQLKGFPPVSFPEDGSLERALDLSEYFTDDIYPDGLSYSVVYEQDATKVHAAVNGSWLSFYSGTQDWFGTKLVRVRATDRGGVFTDSSNISVTIAPVNDPPHFLELPVLNVTEDTIYVFDASPFLGDVDNNIGQLRLALVSPYAETLGHNITLHYPREIGSDRINLTVSDGSASASAWLEVNVRGVNDRPTISPMPTLTTNEDTNISLDLTTFAWDEEDLPGQLKWRAENVPSELITVEVSERNIMTIRPLPEVSGEGMMLLIVRDSGGLEAMVNMTVKVISVNDPPIVDPIPPQRVQVGVPMTLDIKPYVSDVDNSPSELRVTVSTIYASTQGFVVTFLYPNDESLDSETVRVTVSDGRATSHRDVLVQLSFPPSFQEMLGEISLETGREVVIDLTMYASDREDGPLGLSYSVSGVDRTLLEVSVDASGVMKIRSLGKTGRTELKVQATDSDGNTASTNLTVVISSRRVTGSMEVESGVLLWAVPAALVVAIIAVASGFYVVALRRKQRLESEQARIERETLLMGSTAPASAPATRASPHRTPLPTRPCFACGSKLVVAGPGIYQCTKCGRKQS